MILQEMCKRNFGWNDNISQAFTQEWSQWLENLPRITQLTVNRCINLRDFGQIVMYSQIDFLMLVNVAMTQSLLDS